MPEVGLNVLSATPTQTSIHFHYSAVAIAALAAAAVLGAAHLSRADPARAERIALVAVDETQPGNLDAITPLPYARSIAELRRDRRFRLVFEEDGVLVFRRVREPPSG